MQRARELEEQGAAPLGRVARQTAEVLDERSRVSRGGDGAGALHARVAYLGESCRMAPVAARSAFWAAEMLAVPKGGELGKLSLERAALRKQVVGDLLEADELETLVGQVMCRLEAVFDVENPGVIGLVLQLLRPNRKITCSPGKCGCAFPLLHPVNSTEATSCL